MKRSYIQPKSEFVEFGTNGNVMDSLSIQVGSSGKGTVTGSTMQSNREDWEDDDIDWDEE